MMSATPGQTHRAIDPPIGQATRVGETRASSELPSLHDLFATPVSRTHSRECRGISNKKVARAIHEPARKEKDADRRRGPPIGVGQTQREGSTPFAIKRERENDLRSRS